MGGRLAPAVLLEHLRREVAAFARCLDDDLTAPVRACPGWDVGETTLSGPPEMIAERLNEFGAMGVSHLQVRFRNRSLQELLDQMDAFHTGVAPHLHR